MGIETQPPSPLPSKLVWAVDQTYLEGMLRTLRRESVRTGIYLRNAVEAVRMLARQKDLAPPYRETYALLLPLFEPVLEGALRARDAEFIRMPFLGLPPLPDRIDLHGIELEPGWLEKAEDVIARVNATELEMVQQLRDVRAMLLAAHGNGLFDWRHGFEINVSLLLHVPTSRRFYDAEDEYSEPLYIPIGPYSHIPVDADVPNWNPFEHSQNHPLRHCHMEYLMHCILEHACMPWQLLPLLKEVQVHLKFDDWQTLWPMEMRDTGHHVPPQPDPAG